MVTALVVTVVMVVVFREKSERTSHAFVQLESKWRQGRELAIGWSDGAGDMAATGGAACGRPGTRSGSSTTVLGKWISLVCGFGLDCAGSGLWRERKSWQERKG